MNCTPEFYFVVPDNSLLDIGIQRGDSIFCDRNPGSAHYVVGVWDNLAHVCVELSDGALFNAADNTEAPPEGYRLSLIHIFFHGFTAGLRRIQHFKKIQNLFEQHV